MKGAPTFGEAFAEEVELAPHPQSRVQGQGRHASDN
jgi:hypothetical protein